ncbi:MAG: response regulator transcription factor [Coriobacteriaceae bacterium]|nr:response regulator transcription factor [Coriobacteriaceae bacterium]
MRVLIVEDARRLADAMAEVLHANGFTSDIAMTARDAADALALCAYDAILLDIMLPGQDGLSFLTDLRASRDATPVILITARAAVEDRVRGLNLGADDYLPKPFHAEEMIARVRAVVRRPRTMDAPDGIRALGIVLNPLTRELALETSDPAAGTPSPVTLTARESQLMEEFMRAPGLTLKKETLVSRIWGPFAEDAFNRLEVLVRSTRAKLADLKLDVSIETVRGIGYGLRRGGRS